MKVRAQPRPQTIVQARAELSRRLEGRREEIERAVMTRVYAVADPGDLDPIYAEGLKAAVSAAVDYGLGAVGTGEERSPPPPPILLAQARLAARAGVSLDTVLRRYFAGHALLGDYLIEEAEGGRLLRGAALQRLMRTQAALFDRLLEAVSEEHVRERNERLGSWEERQTKQVERLLAGELVDVSEIPYDFEVQHVGIVAHGSGMANPFRPRVAWPLASQPRVWPVGVSLTIRLKLPYQSPCEGRIHSCATEKSRCLLRYYSFGVAAKGLTCGSFSHGGGVRGIGVKGKKCSSGWDLDRRWRPGAGNAMLVHGVRMDRFQKPGDDHRTRDTRVREGKQRRPLGQRRGWLPDIGDTLGGFQIERSFRNTLFHGRIALR